MARAVRTRVVVISGGRPSAIPPARSDHSTANSVRCNIPVQTTVTRVNDETRITSSFSSEAYVPTISSQPHTKASKIDQ